MFGEASDELTVCKRDDPLSFRHHGRGVPNRRVGDTMIQSEALVGVGVVDVALHFRDDVAGDAGLCVQVYAKVAGRDTELLRFDCFTNAPHYHYGPEAANERLMLDATASGDPLDWTLERFERGRLKAMVRRAGYDAVADAIDDGAVQAALPALAEHAREIVARHTT